MAKQLTMVIAKAKFSLARAKIGRNAEQILAEELIYASKSTKFEVENPKVTSLDEYAPDLYGIEVSVRVLWEGLVVKRDISRAPDSIYDTGRASQPAFQDMNFGALRRRKENEPLPVLYQCSDDPLDARMLVMAYEEEGKVLPVVSDFDCFLIGSRNYTYQDQMPEDQVDLLDWCVSQIEWILDNQTEPESWTSKWLEILKNAARQNFYPQMPRFGFGDPTSYSMIEAAVSRSAKTCGAVRHGPECFNYFFPQDLDEEFLIIFPDNQLWKYVNAKELRSILREKIFEGFTFPLNPKWVLCDPGWISLFKQLISSRNPSVRNSVDLWFPPDSGLKERILEISKRHPTGFQSSEGSKEMDSELAEQEYERYLVLQRAKKKMRGFLFWKHMLDDAREKGEGSEDANVALEEFSFLGQKKIKRLLDMDSIEGDEMERAMMNELKRSSFFGKSGEENSLSSPVSSP